MKNEYGKKDYQKGYQATNKLDKENRNPNAPTQGGFSTPGGGQGQGKTQQKNPQQQYNKTQTNTNTWGKDSISGDKNKDRNK